jgi:hypothetical protein
MYLCPINFIIFIIREIPFHFMPPQSVMTMTEISEAAACICIAVPVVAYFGAVAIGFKGGILNYIVTFGAIIGFILAMICMTAYWRNFQ